MLALLLDTHTLLWCFIGDNRLSRELRDQIISGRNRVFVSTVSAWEIATKFRLGKLPMAEELLADFAGYVSRNGFELIELSLQDGIHAGLLPGPHKDPFDRMLVAQALRRDLTLVTIEEIFDQYGVRRLW